MRGRLAVEVARGANLLFAREGDHKPGGLVPVVVPDGVRVFGVGNVIFTGEDLRFLLEPTSLQSQNLGVLGRELQFGGRALIQREDILHVVPRQEVRRGRIVEEDLVHRRSHQVVLVHGLETEDLLDGAGKVDLRVEDAVFGYPSTRAIGVDLLLDVGAENIARAAVTVDVVNAVLRVVFLDEDRRGVPDRSCG